MTRPLSIASIVSVALHVGVVVALALLFAQVQFSVVDTLPVLSVDLSTVAPGKARVDESAEELQTQEVIADVPVPRVPDTPEADKVIAEPPGQRQPVMAATSARAAEHRAAPPLAEVAQSVEPVEPQSAAPQPGDVKAAGQPQTSEVVATVAPSALQVASVVTAAAQVQAEHVDVGARQQRMLNRRLQKMFRSPRTLAKAESGIEWKHRGQSYSAQFERRPASSDTDLEHVVVRVSTQENGQTLSTEMVMRRLAFSSFGQFVNRWDPHVQIHDDVIDGRFHSNTDVTLAYGDKISPVFNGAVTIAGDSIRVNESSGRVRRSEMFRAGLQTNVRAISLPGAFLQSSQRPADDTQIRIFDADTRLHFFADGTYEWSPADGQGATGRERLRKPTQYLLAEKVANLHVSGIVSGKVLVYSPGRILIENDLVYADDPRFNPQSEDFIGLVAEKTIEIAEADVTGPGDLEVHAAICARRGFRVRGHGTGDNTDLLYLYGSLTVGTVDATEPRYRTRIEFDDRLETARPPAFPVTDRYDVVAWDGQWEVEN